MSSRIAVVPGSFDPPTLGHLDVIRRAAALYDELHVLVVHNPGKEAMLPIAQRLALLERSIAEDGMAGNIIIGSWSMGLLVDYARDVNAGVLVKGIRSQVDVAYESPMAIVNRHLADIDDRIARLTGLRQEVQAMVEQCSGGHVRECRIIEVLADHGECLHERH